jgi:hypothetical protein
LVLLPLLLLRAAGMVGCLVAVVVAVVVVFLTS